MRASMPVPALVLALVLSLGGAALADPRVLAVDDIPAATGSVAGQGGAPAEAAPAAQAASPVTAAPASGQTAAASLPPARFRFERANDGFLRFDNQNGQIAFCAPHAAGWACEAVPEDRAALEKEIGRQQDQIGRQQEEIGRLQGQIEDLRREIAALREPPPPPRPPADLTPPKEGAKPGDKNNDVVIKLPTQEDIDRATAALQRAWERVVDMIGNLRKDLSRKAQPDRTTL